MEVLEMTPKEVHKLHNAFIECDSDKSGEVRQTWLDRPASTSPTLPTSPPQISMAEFSEYLQIEHTVFAERVFGILDLDSSGVMDFEVRSEGENVARVGVWEGGRKGRRKGGRGGSGPTHASMVVI